MKNSVLSKIFTGVLCLSVMVGVVGCVKPKEPTEEDVVKKIEEMIPEKIELVSHEDDKYVFKSKVRDLTFEVEPHASTLNIDGADFGYTGDYSYGNTYTESVYAFYRERVEKIIADHGFEISAQSDPDMVCINSFTIAAYNWLSEDEIDNINDFCKDLRELTKEEAQYHDDPYDFTFEVEFLWIDVWGGKASYIRTAGNYNYSNKIGPDITDEEIDVRNLRMTNMNLSNVIPPVYNGVLIEILGEAEDLIEEEG